MEYLNEYYSGICVVISLACLYVAEQIDADRAAPAEHRRWVFSREILTSIVFYAASSLVGGIIIQSFLSPSSQLKDSAKVYMIAVLLFGSIVLISTVFRFFAIASRGAASFVRATGIFILNLSIFYLVVYLKTKS